MIQPTAENDRLGMQLDILLCAVTTLNATGGNRTNNNFIIIIVKERKNKRHDFLFKGRRLTVVNRIVIKFLTLLAFK